MKTNFMRTIIKSLLCLALLIALIGTANAAGPAGPPTNLVGSWSCGGDDGSVLFLVNFNQGGTLTASGLAEPYSVYYGTWRRTGLNTFASKDLGFEIDDPGCILTTDTTMTMSDNDNFAASATISNPCNNNQTPQVSFTCTRTQF